MGAENAHWVKSLVLSLNFLEYWKQFFEICWCVKSAYLHGTMAYYKKSTSLSHHKVSYSRRKPSSSHLSHSHHTCLDIFNANTSESMSGNVSKWMATDFAQKALRGQPRWDKTTCFEQCSEICQTNMFSLARVSCFSSPSPPTFFFPLPLFYHLSLIKSDYPGKGSETKTEGPTMSAPGEK